MDVQVNKPESVGRGFANKVRLTDRINSVSDATSLCNTSSLSSYIEATMTNFFY